MKKYYSLILTAVMAVVMVLSAQAANPQFEGVLGMNFSTINRNGISFRPGFHAGVRGIYEIPTVTQGFYVNAAALLSLKGYKNDSVSYCPFFVDVPIHAGYKYDVDDRFAMFIEAGPYMGVGLFGKCEGKNIFSEEVGYKRFDVGFGVRGGVEFIRRISVSLGGDFGFLQVKSGTSARPRNVTASVAYKF